MISVIAGISGLVIGSFFNVLIWRLPRGESVVFPASHCVSCGRKIRPWENIPVLSYLFLRGKCASCKEPISPVYPLIELITGGASAALWYLFAQKALAGNADIFLSTSVILQALFLLMMIPMAVIDFRHYIIPDFFTLPIITAGLIISFLPGGITPLQSFIGILGGGGVLYLIGWIGTIALKKGDAMGGGDIKLMAAAGALFGLEISLMGIVFGALLGSVAGIGMIVTKKLSVDHRIPFGPFLGAGIWIAVLAGKAIVNFYIGFMDSLVIAL